MKLIIFFCSFLVVLFFSGEVRSLHAQQADPMLTVRVNGNAFSPENPLQLAYDGIRHSFWGSSFVAPAGTSLWFHAPLPHFESELSRQALVRAVYVLFQSKNSFITAVQVWDGPFKLETLEKLELSGAHNARLDEKNLFQLKKRERVTVGLGISVLVNFGNDGMLNGKPVGEIIFTGAGAFLEAQASSALQPANPSNSRSTPESPRGGSKPARQ